MSPLNCVNLKKYVSYRNAAERGDMLTLKDDVVANGTISLEQLIHFYKNGFRQFKNIIVDLRNDVCIFFPFLSDVTFENCSMIHLQVGAQLHFSDKDEKIIINGCDYYKENSDELENTESLFSIFNKKQIVTRNKNKYQISASLFLASMPYLKEKPKAHLVDRLDLSVCKPKGNNIVDHINAIDEFIHIDFSHCTFSKGIVLPDFILNQIEKKEAVIRKLSEKNISPAYVIAVLKESRDSFLKMIKQFDQKTKTKGKYKYNDSFQKIKSGKSSSNLSDHITYKMNLSGDFIEDQIKNKKNKYWRGCVVETPIQFSAHSVTRITQVDFQNATFRDTVDFSHMRLSGWSMAGAQFKKNIVMNEFSDFRGCQFSHSWKNDTQITYQIKNKSYELKGDAKQIYEKIKKEYYRIRDSQKMTIFRSDFFEKLEKKICPENGSNQDSIYGARLLEVFNHIQKKRHVLTGEKKSRTWDALRNIVTESIEADLAIAPEPRHEAQAIQVDLPSTPRCSVHSENQNELNNQIEEKKAECEKTMDSLFSSFYNSPYFFGSDDGSDSAIAERVKNENHLIDSYLFLKKISPESVLKYHALMNNVIYPNYLYYVVYRKRICDETGKQIRYFRYTLFEKLISVMNPEKKERATSLVFLSRHRDDIRYTAQFFSHGSDVANEFKKYCLTEWANLPLSYYPIVNDISEIDIEHIQKTLVHDNINTTIEDQKNHLIAYLISGDIQKSELLKTEFEAFLTAFSPAKLNHVLLSDAIENVMNKVVKELCELKRTGGMYYCWLDSVLRIFEENHLNMPIDLQFKLYDVKNRMKSIEEGILIHKIINHIQDNLENHLPLYPYLIDSFTSCHDYSLVWIGDVNAKRMQLEKWNALKNSDNRQMSQLYSVLMKTVMNSSTIYDVQKGIKPARLGHRLSFQLKNAVYHIDDVIDDLKKTVLTTLQYSQIKPIAKLQNGFLSHEILPENAVMNPEKNSFKFSALVGLQNVYEKSLKLLCSDGCTATIILDVYHRFHVCLNAIIDLLVEKKEAHHNLFSSPSFLDHIHQAKKMLLESEKKWQAQQSLTLFLQSEQLLPIDSNDDSNNNQIRKEKLKTKIILLVQPVFDYMHNQVSQVNAAIPEGETKIVGDDRSEFGAYESMYYLQYRMQNAAYQYRRVYILQEKCRELQRHIDCMVSLDMHHIAEHVFDALIAVLEDSMAEATRCSSHYFRLDEYGALIESAISACKEEKKCWIYTPAEQASAVQI